MSEAADKPKARPFATAKPRSEWKKCFKRVHGRIVADVQTGPEPKDTELFIFELKSDGLRVRKKRGWKSKAKLWKFESLVNGVATVGGQMKLL